MALPIAPFEENEPIPEVALVPGIQEQDQVVTDGNIDVQVQTLPMQWKHSPENIHASIFNEHMIRERLHMWSNSFARVNADNKVLVPKAWIDFFIQHMMEPYTFEWAKKFLCSISHLASWTRTLKQYI